MEKVHLSFGVYSNLTISKVKIYRDINAFSPSEETLVTTLSGGYRNYTDEVEESGTYYYIIESVLSDGAVYSTENTKVEVVKTYDKDLNIPEPSITVLNWGKVEGDIVDEIGNHLESDWLIEYDQGIETSIDDGSNLTEYLTKHFGEYEMTARVRYKGDKYSTEWSRPVTEKVYRRDRTDFGELLEVVPASNFITGEQLADSIGLTAGTSQYSDTPWLKFSLDGEIIYIPKKPQRSHISWEDIYQAGAVYGTGDNGANPSGGNRLQDASVTIGGYDFKVTLLRGANDDPTPDASGYDEPWTHNSEWNKLMYPIHSGVHADSRNPSNGSVPYNQWASYSDEDLLVHRDFGNGSRNWTQETHGGSNSYRLYRGSIGVTYVYRYTSTSSNSGFGWRPALRLVQ